MKNVLVRFYLILLTSVLFAVAILSFIFHIPAAGYRFLAIGAIFALLSSRRILGKPGWIKR